MLFNSRRRRLQQKNGWFHSLILIPYCFSCWKNSIRSIVRINIYNNIDPTATTAAVMTVERKALLVLVAPLSVALALSLKVPFAVGMIVTSSSAVGATNSTGAATGAS